MVNILTILLITFFMVSGFSWLIARLWCLPQRDKSKKRPEEYNIHYENVSFPSSNRILKGWFMPVSINKGPVVIIQHGWSHSKARMLPVAKEVLDKVGCSVFIFDSRGHGESDNDGPVTLLKMAEDLSSSINYLKTRKDVDMDNIGVFGHSIGGASTILAGSLDSRINAIVSTSAFADPVGVTIKYMKKFHIPKWPFVKLVFMFIERWVDEPIENIFPRNNIHKINVPTLLVHGKKDNFITPENIAILYENSNSELTESHILPDCSHSNIIVNSSHFQLVTDFLKKHMFTEKKNETTKSLSYHSNVNP
ncbi:MAG: alpha/beta hydrolase [Desulfobacterales bacterium]|nr:alpha/beta hydrolase [Desulfobacterales bacterium]